MANDRHPQQATTPDHAQGKLAHAPGQSTLDELRAEARRHDIRVWPVEQPLWLGDTARFRYRRGNVEAGGLDLPTEEACLEYLLRR